MAGSVNKVILVGNLGKDPEVRAFQNGGRVAKFSVATSDSWKDRNTGERRERTEWHRVVIYSDPLIGIAERYLRKGSKVYLEGQLETSKWTDQSGQEKYTTEVVLRPYRGELTMLDGRSGGGGDSGFGGGGDGGFGGGSSGPDRDYDAGGGFGGSSSGGGSGGYGGGRAPGPQRPSDDLDDEIPF